eukprot:7179858-Prymnesium_polylepis.1
MAAEDREVGVVAGRLWARYCMALGFWSMLNLTLIYLGSQFFTYGSSWWLGEWARDAYPKASNGQPWFYMAVYAGLSL